MGQGDSKGGGDKRLETLATQHAGMYLRSSATHLLNKAPYLDIGACCSHARTVLTATVPAELKLLTLGLVRC